MNPNFSRHLSYLLQNLKHRNDTHLFKSAGPTALEEPRLVIPPEFTGRDYLAFLLSIDAELEHGLMLQYLYAAYSLGGPQVPPEHRAQVKHWQDVILGIAKEEMGHFVSVQNVLRLIGAPLHFGRQDYPWDTPFYPFPFKLEPLSLGSLAKYVFAESPVGWIDSQEAKDLGIYDLIQSEDHGDPISYLFKTILQLIEDRDAIPDSVFEEQTYPYQAHFDEWGRGYSAGNRGNATSGGFQGTPDVLVASLSFRDDAANALKAISEQGEAPSPDKDGGLPSHFERFLTVYIEMKDALASSGSATPWTAARNLAVNPYIESTGNPEESPSQGLTTKEERDQLRTPQAVNWAHLSNVRYRMLLSFIAHSFLLDKGWTQAGAISQRGTIVNASFGEMYNLRAIANVLIQLPIERDSPKFAGPPFLMPYTLDLPMDEADRWKLHRDLIQASAQLIHGLKAISSPDHVAYLSALEEADQNLLKIVNQLTGRP